MSVLKKAFLYMVGAVSVAYEESIKAVKQQQKRLTRATGKIKA